MINFRENSMTSKHSIPFSLIKDHQLLVISCSLLPFQFEIKSVLIQVIICSLESINQKKYQALNAQFVETKAVESTMGNLLVRVCKNFESNQNIVQRYDKAKNNRLLPTLRYILLFNCSLQITHSFCYVNRSSVHVRRLCI